MKTRPAKAPPIPAHPGVMALEDEAVWDRGFPLQRVRFPYARLDGTELSPVREAVAFIERFRLPALAAGLVEPGRGWSGAA